MILHGESAYKLSKITGVHPNSIGKAIKNPDYILDLNSLIKIADHYGVTLDYLVGREEGNKLHELLAIALKERDEYKHSAIVLRKSMQELLKEKEKVK